MILEVDYCVLSAVTRYIEEHPETWDEIETKINKLLGGDKQIYPLTAISLDHVNQRLWQDYDNDNSKE